MVMVAGMMVVVMTCIRGGGRGLGGNSYPQHVDKSHVFLTPPYSGSVTCGLGFGGY